MPYPSILQAADYTTRRGGIYSAARYVVPHTETVLFSCHPAANADGTSAAQISYSSTLSGDYQDVPQYASVYITPTSDYQNDLVSQPENCLRTYARLEPSSTAVYIGLTAFQWTTSSYITIVDNFEIFEKKTVIESGTILKNVSVTYRAPLPRIYDLYHDVVVATGSTYDYSPTPSEEAMASGASISSRSWTVIENGTVTKAASTSATPTFTLDVGTHWLHLTTTDSNGNTNVTVAFIAVVPSDYSSVVTGYTSATVNKSLSGGLSADIEAFADTNSQISNLVPGMFGLVFSVVNFKDASTSVVLECCGWFDAPTQVDYAADETSGYRKLYNTQLLGVKEVAENIRLPAFPFQYNASPSAWGQVARCTVYDAVWYLLSEHSTATVVSSIDFPSSYTDYQYNPAIDVPSGTLVDSMAALAFRAAGGGANYAPNGEIIFAQSALYMTSGRDSLDTFADYDIEAADGQDYGFSKPPVNRFALSSVEGGFATFNTTTNLPRIYRSVAPANETSAALFERFDGVIMAKNLTNAQALAEAGKLTANHFFAANESGELQARYITGYIDIVPSNFQWHTFDIPTTYFLDGSILDSNTRFLCTSVSSTFNVEAFGFDVSATFREETDGGDNYARETEFVPSTTEQVHSVYPIGTFSPFLDEFDIQSASDTYGDDFDDYNEGIEDPTLPPEEAAEEQGNQPGVIETLYVPLRGGAVGTSFNTTLGPTYIIRASGSGSLGTGGWCYNFDFTASDGSWTKYVNSSPAEDRALYSAGVGWVRAGTASVTQQAIVQIQRTFTSSFVTSVTVVVDTAPTLGFQIRANDVNGSTYSSGVVSANQTSATVNINKTLTGLWVSVSNPDGTDYTGAITSIQVKGSGTNPFGASNCGTGGEIFGDAFYYFGGEDGTGTAYSAAGGLNLDGSGIVHSEAYNAAHTYEVSATGTGNPFTFSFVDSVDSDLTNNENRYLRVEVLQ